MDTHHQILVVDDDADWLDLCRDFLGRLPSKPEIRTAASGTRAVAMMDAQPFRVLLCDLKMPRMDGFQVISIVRRRFPRLRTVIVTALTDPGLRSHAYALGVELFWLKPDMERNPQMFLDCIESLLGGEDEGFRDLQNKNLLDVIQMECVLRNSSVLRINSGPHAAQVWINDGQVIDARADGADGEAAFRKILKWKSGTFETLPAETNHVQTIVKSVEAMLLEEAQAVERSANPTPAEEAAEAQLVRRLTALSYEGAEFVVTVPAKKEDNAKGWGTRDVERIAAWARYARRAAQRIGEKFSAGPLIQAAGSNLEHQLLLLPKNGKTFVVGWPPEAEPGRMVERSKKLIETWDS
ncbi:MAG TPA: response regulator [Verrucomicrobiae bacterium]|nr:response regulator [Verrucomicrobiae bacterium]